MARKWYTIDGKDICLESPLAQDLANWIRDCWTGYYYLEEEKRLKRQKASSILKVIIRLEDKWQNNKPYFYSG